MECLNSGLEIFLKRSVQISVVVTPLHTNRLRQQTTLLSWNLIVRGIAITTLI